MSKFLEILNSPILMGAALGVNCLLFGTGFFLGDIKLMSISGVSIVICYFAAFIKSNGD